MGKNSHELEKRLGSKLADTVSVSDREADVYEFIQYKVSHNQRFVLRASHDRTVLDSYIFAPLQHGMINKNETMHQCWQWRALIFGFLCHQLNLNDSIKVSPNLDDKEENETILRVY